MNEPTSEHLTGTLPIAVIGQLASRMQATNLLLFERLGSWITATSEPRLQRLLAAACHRHAWHAELWEARRPAIPFRSAAEPIEIDEGTSDAERRRCYGAVLDAVAGELADVVTAIDPDLDPATARVLELVEADVFSLRRALAELG